MENLFDFFAFVVNHRNSSFLRSLCYVSIAATIFHINGEASVEHISDFLFLHSMPENKVAIFLVGFAMDVKDILLNVV